MEIRLDIKKINTDLLYWLMVNDIRLLTVVSGPRYK